MIGRRALSLAIRGYRRWLSGRGPLRRVSCTFASTESCSAYGLRAVDEIATSLPHAIGLVRARVRACRHASVYRFANGLGWERAHDEAPSEIARSMVARGERADTVAQVIAARMMVAKWRGEREAYAHARSLASPIPARDVESPIPARDIDRAIATHPIPAREMSTIAKHPIPVRAGDAAIRYHQRVARRAGVLAVVAVMLVVVSIFALVPFAMAIGAAMTARSAAKRLERQRVAAGFLRPRIEASWTSWYSAPAAGLASSSPTS